MLALLKQHLKHFLLFELPYQLSPLTLIEQSSQLVLRSSCILSLRTCGLPVVGALNYERAYILKRFTNIASHPLCCVFETVLNSLINFLTLPVGSYDNCTASFSASVFFLFSLAELVMF